MINPVTPVTTTPQAPTENTPTPPLKPQPFTVHDHVTLSSTNDKDHGCNGA
jgi:hypothetical protein